MTTPNFETLPTIERLRMLLTQYDLARAGMALILAQPATPARQVLAALRGMVAAEVEILRVIDRPDDRPALDALSWELQRLDRELAECAANPHHTN